MALLTKHLAQAKTNLIKNSQQTINNNGINVFIPKIVMSDDNRATSLSVDVGMTLDMVNGVPVFHSNQESSIILKIIVTKNTELKNQLIQNSLNFGLFRQILDENLAKVQQIEIPYENEGKIEGKKIEFVKNVSLNMPSTVNPENLYIFCLAYIKSNNNLGIPISKIILQDIIVSNQVVFSNNLLDVRVKNLENYLNFDIINQVDKSREAYFSEQYVSLDPSGYLKFIFMWDKIQFLQEKSVFGNVLKNCSVEESKTKIISDSRISDIKIMKRRVKRNIDGFSNFLKNQKNEVVISSSDDADGDLLIRQKTNTKTGKIEAKISSLSKLKNSNNFILFAVDDYSPKTVKTGQYQYYISVKVEDGMLKFLLESLSSLRSAKKQLVKYRNVFGPSYKAKNETLDSAKSILNILFSLGKFSTSQQQQISFEFESMLRFEDGLSAVLDFNDNLMEKISYALGNRGVSSKENANKSYQKNTKDLFVLEDQQKFNDIVDFSTLIGKKQEFLDSNYESETGAAIFEEPAIKERFLKEFKKIINLDENFEDINFSDLNQKILSSNLGSNTPKNDVSELFNFKNNFFSYLSPYQIPMEDKQIKNEDFIINNYNPVDHGSLTKISHNLISKGLRIIPPAESNKRKEENQNNDICAEEIFGEDSNLLDEKTNQGPNPTFSVTNKEKFYDTQQKAYNFSSGVEQYYNNFNLRRQDYDLNYSNNLINKKDTKENNQLFSGEIGDMPNQIRSLFGSNSDLVKNKWNFTETDFFASPTSQKMMQQNYSNLIKVEVLEGFQNDAAGQKNIKSPIFKKLEFSDISKLKDGETLLCRTFLLNDRSLGIGQRQNSTKEPIYYNKHFLIKKGSE